MVRNQQKGCHADRQLRGQIRVAANPRLAQLSQATDRRVRAATQQTCTRTRPRELHWASYAASTSQRRLTVIVLVGSPLRRKFKVCSVPRVHLLPGTLPAFALLR